MTMITGWKKYSDVLTQDEYEELRRSIKGSKIGAEFQRPIILTILVTLIIFFCWLGYSKPFTPEDYKLIGGCYALTIPLWLWSLYRGLRKADSYTDFVIDCIVRVRKGEEFMAEINGYTIVDSRPGGNEYEDAKRWKAFYAKNGYLNQA